LVIEVPYKAKVKPEIEEVTGFHTFNAAVHTEVGSSQTELAKEQFPTRMLRIPAEIRPETVPFPLTFRNDCAERIL
jgi:hypothetical protein